MKCARPKCDDPVYQDASRPAKIYCSRRCARIVQKQKARERKNHPDSTFTSEPPIQSEEQVIEKLTHITCGRYACDVRFVPTSINHRFHSTYCQEAARKEKHLLDTVGNIDEIDPALLRAKTTELVREVERQKEIVGRALVRAESRTAVVQALVREFLDEHPGENQLFPSPVLVDRAGGGRPTECHVLFSDPQAGKLENGVGLEILLNDYIPRYLKAILECVAVQRHEGPVDTLILHLLGDLVENCIIFAGQRQTLDRAFNGDSVVDQTMIMFIALRDFVRILRPNFKYLKVACAWGNHGRTSTKHDPNLPKDNYDRLIGLLLQEWFAGVDDPDMRIEFIIPEDDRYVLTSYGWRFGGIHGHQLQGKSSLNAMELTVLRWDAIAHFKENLDYLVMGHRHHAASLEVNGIEIIQNPAMDGGSSWFTNTTGAWSPPRQELFFVSEKYGKDSQHPIYFDQRQPRMLQMRDRLRSAGVL